MSEQVVQPFYIRVFSVLLFLLLPIACLVWFGSSLTSLIFDLINMRNVITFDKGSMYMLGSGVGVLSLAVAVVYTAIYQRRISFTVEKVLIKIALIAMVVMFVLPQVAHLSIDHVISDNGYQECEPLSHRGLRYSKYVFTQDEETCINLVAEKSLSRH